ncbi:hypothetical protein G8764_19925 [Pseudomaricurvus alcaniphilus]|uniref:hypothetical protein n=1 Tax=Pseudomaricurvus alcaniphilus TaxID=1166482 RepID=UPI0014077DBF|nr:hypothetical protein [Pseudomaricurvus alcaniphilus]NHN39575.1 hypothetical protein [Pseudomaricurvus alcaniphilus]
MKTQLKISALAAALLLSVGVSAGGTNYGETAGFGEAIDYVRGHTAHGNGKGNGHDCNKPGKRVGHPECASPD